MDKEPTPYYKDLQEVRIPDLQSLRGKNILVTGSTGLIGSALIELLLIYADRYDITIYAGSRSKVKFTSRFEANKNLYCLELDVTKPLASDLKFDYIIHAASGASPSAFSTDPVGVMKANLLGAANLLDYGISHGIERFLYLSTGEVYGEGCIDKWAEKDSGHVDPMSVRSCYPSSKRATETLCVAYARQFNIDTVVARLCHTYGPMFTKHDNRVYAQFIRNVLHGENVILKSKGEQYRSWIYVVDCVAALLYILVNGQSGEAYNVANEESNITIKQLAEVVANVAGQRVVYDLPPSKEQLASTPITRALFDTSKIEALGWKPRTSIKTGIVNTINSLR